MSKDYYKPFKNIEISKPDVTVQRERGVRFYCNQFRSSWSIQLRAPETLSNGKEGKSFYIATGRLDRETLVELRNAIDAHLAY